MGLPHELTLDLIPAAEAVTLPGLFQRRCERTPEAEAYRQYDPLSADWKSYSWRRMRTLAATWQAALARERLAPGERVAVSLKNSVEWVCFDQASQALGLVVVPLYTTDNPENTAYILGDCGARLLLLGEIEQWRALAPLQERFPQLARVLCATPAAGAATRGGPALDFVPDWLAGESAPLPLLVAETNALATIVYTSGTTGRPKGGHAFAPKYPGERRGGIEAGPGLPGGSLSFVPAAVLHLRAHRWLLLADDDRKRSRLHPLGAGAGSDRHGEHPAQQCSQVGRRGPAGRSDQTRRAR